MDKLVKKYGEDMNITDIAFEIQKKIKEIDNIRKEVRERGEAKAASIGEYEKALAVVIIALKNGTSFELNNEKIINPQATYLKDIAKGLCFLQKIKMETAEAMYKSVLVNLEAAQSQLNALQSLFRHLDSV